MTLVYSLSGLALNHMHDWNPSYDITVSPVQWETLEPGGEVSKEALLSLLDRYGEKDNYKQHYFPESGIVHIFLKNGNVELDLRSGRGMIERIKKRPLFFQVNFLHYNPKRLWTWFSDVFCLSLILVAVTGLFIIRGKNGISGRGAWLTGVGILIPLIFLFFYLI